MKISEIDDATLMQFIDENYGKATLEKVVRKFHGVKITRSTMCGDKKQMEHFAFLQQSPEVSEILVYWRDGSGVDRNITAKFDMFIDEINKNASEEEMAD